MQLETEIEHTDLDPPADDDGDEATTTVHATIIMADGMRYSSTVETEGQADDSRLAQMLCAAAHGVASTASRQLGERIPRTPLPPLPPMKGY